MSQFNEEDGAAEPQSCYKCNRLPEDILMLACGHDLCLECAALRLSIESKRKTATGIVCEFCSQKTQLDADSIFELQKLIQTSQPKPKRDVRESNLRINHPLDDDDIKRTDKYTSKYERSSRNEKKQVFYPKFDNYSSSPSLEVPTNYKQSTSVIPISQKKNCPEHPDEQILYYCFDCNCQCICPECVIHGKHKNHEVKTIKKSQPIIKSKLQHFLQNIDTNIDGLISKKNEFQNHIKGLVDENNSNKKQVQRSFADLRNKLNIKEKQILAKCNKVLESTIDNYQRGIKTIVKKIQDIKSSSHTINDHLKKEQLTMLNFYAKKHSDFQQLIQKIDTNSLVQNINDKLLSHDIATQMIQKIADEIDQLDIDSSVRYDAKYDQKQKQSGRHSYDREQHQASRIGGKYSRQDDKPRQYVRRY